MREATLQQLIQKEGRTLRDQDIRLAATVLADFPNKNDAISLLTKRKKWSIVKAAAAVHKASHQCQ